jgi:hypothetical protein
LPTLELNVVLREVRSTGVLAYLFNPSICIVQEKAELGEDLQAATRGGISGHKVREIYYIPKSTIS